MTICYSIENLKKYQFAAVVFATMNVIDANCGLGYGSDVLTKMGCKVCAYDKNPMYVAHSRWNYRNPNVKAIVADIEMIKFPDADAAVSFNTLEYLHNPQLFLNSLKNSCGLLIGSVPNQDVDPWTVNSEAKKHYTHQDIHDLLQESGWRLNYIWSQDGGNVSRNPKGKIILFGASVSGYSFPKISI